MTKGNKGHCTDLNPQATRVPLKSAFYFNFNFTEPKKHFVLQPQTKQAHIKHCRQHHIKIIHSQNKVCRPKIVLLAVP